MIALIIKSYFILFLSVGLSSLIIFMLGLYWIFKASPASPKNFSDFSSIAGDDVIATQLDLARAYIETNNKKVAKKILKVVIHQGNQSQKDEARTLLGLI